MIDLRRAGDSRCHWLFGQDPDSRFERRDDIQIVRGIDSSDNQDVELAFLKHLGEVILPLESASCMAQECSLLSQMTAIQEGMVRK